MFLILNYSYFHHTLLNYLLLMYHCYSCITDNGWCFIWNIIIVIIIIIIIIILHKLTHDKFISVLKHID